MESLVEKFASSYRDIVSAALSEDGVSEERKEILLTKFVSLFTDKLRLVHNPFFCSSYRKLIQVGPGLLFWKEYGQNNKNRGLCG